MKKFTAASLAAIVMAGFSAPALAADVTLDPLNCSGAPVTCTKSYDFTVPAAGPVAQGFTFTLPVGGKFSGSVTTEFTAPSQDIDFTSILIDGVSPYTQDIFDPNGEHWFIKNLNLASGLHRIDFVGTAAGAGVFAGTISFAAVPEPATWGMMILGFGLVGGALRSRKKVTVRYA